MSSTAETTDRDAPTPDENVIKSVLSSDTARLWWWRLAFGAAVLVFWELTSGRLYSSFWFSKPSAIAQSLYESFTSGQLISDVAITLRAAVLGYGFGAVLGVVLGFVIAELRTVAKVLNPYILAVYGIPRIALAPLFIVWFGIGITSKIMLAALMTFFLTFFNTFTGVGQIDDDLVNVARVLDAGRLTILRKVVLPAASPWIIAGLRIAIPYAIVAAIVGEFIASTAGLGFRIMQSTQLFNTTGTLAGILVIMVLVMIFNLILDRLESYLLRWQPSSERPGGGTQS
ncbi:MAG: ABC transporter permease [Actinobacteria bacterium]|nr:ABC transporter permease [Actinomycetota bacterium]